MPSVINSLLAHCQENPPIKQIYRILLAVVTVTTFLLQYLPWSHELLLLCFCLYAFMRYGNVISTYFYEMPYKPSNLSLILVPGALFLLILRYGTHLFDYRPLWLLLLAWEHSLETTHDWTWSARLIRLLSTNEHVTIVSVGSLVFLLITADEFYLHLMMAYYFFTIFLNTFGALNNAPYMLAPGHGISLLVATYMIGSPINFSETSMAWSYLTDAAMTAFLFKEFTEEIAAHLLANFWNTFDEEESANAI